MLTAVIAPTSRAAAEVPTEAKPGTLPSARPSWGTGVPQLPLWQWIAVVGGGLVLGAFLLPKATGGLLSGATTPSMLKTIASEARSPHEFARRAEAWNASEASPLSLTLLAKAYRGSGPSTTVRLLREAREERLEKRERLWSRMSKGLRGRG